MRPSEIPRNVVEEIISNTKLLLRTGYNGHKLGYLLAIEDSEWIQFELLAHPPSRALKVTHDGKSVAHIVASNLHSDKIRDCILSNKDINSIKDYYGNTVESVVVFNHIDHDGTIINLRKG